MQFYQKALIYGQVCEWINISKTRSRVGVDWLKQIVHFFLLGFKCLVLCPHFFSRWFLHHHPRLFSGLAVGVWKIILHTSFREGMKKNKIWENERWRSGQKGNFRGYLGGFEGFGPCLGISHPTNPHLGKISQKKRFFYSFPYSTYNIVCVFIIHTKSHGFAIPLLW